jgi:hypothetical protein
MNVANEASVIKAVVASKRQNKNRFLWADADDFMSRKKRLASTIGISI